MQLAELGTVTTRKSEKAGHAHNLSTAGQRQVGARSLWPYKMVSSGVESPKVGNPYVQ